MAVGEGGFSVKPMGFDRNEVNEYISNLRKRMQDMEALINSNGEKAMAAAKAVEEAKSKLAAAQSEKQQTIDNYEERLKNLRGRLDDLENQTDELKRQLRNAGKSAKGGSAADEKRAAEIIAKAQAEAKSIIEKAKQSAAKMTAQKSGAGASADTAALLGAVHEFMNSVTASFNKLTVKTSGAKESPRMAAALSDSRGFAPSFEQNLDTDSEPGLGGGVDMSDFGGDFSMFSAPMDSNDTSKDMSGGMSMFGAPMDMGMSMDNNAPSDLGRALGGDPAAFGASMDMGMSADDNAPSDLGSALGGDLAAFGAPMDMGMSANDNAPSDLGSALGGDMSMFAAPMDMGMNANDNAPSDLASAMGDDLSMFAMSGALASGIADGNGIGSSFGTDMASSDPLSNTADSISQLLSSAENTFGSIAAPAQMTEHEAAPDANPWADLQAQLNEEYESGSTFGGSDSFESDPFASPASGGGSDDRAVPDTDDDSLWGFGGSSDSDDDMSGDMSGDLFGSF